MARDGPPGVGFLQRNGLGWLRPLQSGSMANDVYRKSAWVFGDNVLPPPPGGDEGDDGAEGDDDGEGAWAGKRQRRQQRKDRRLHKRARRAAV